MCSDLTLKLTACDVVARLLFHASSLIPYSALHNAFISVGPVCEQRTVAQPAYLPGLSFSEATPANVEVQFDPLAFKTVELEPAVAL